MDNNKNKPFLLYDGPRFKKLKEIFKKTIDETLIVKNDAINTKNTDDLDNNEILTDELKTSIRSGLNDVFKNKINEYQLDILLNKLDADISNKRTSFKQITDTDYIKEIFESNIVDNKERLIAALQLSKEQHRNDVDELKNELKELKEKTKILNDENKEHEEEYVKIISF